MRLLAAALVLVLVGCGDNPRHSEVPRVVEGACAADDLDLALWVACRHDWIGCAVCGHPDDSYTVWEQDGCQWSRVDYDPRAGSGPLESAFNACERVSRLSH